MKFNLRSVFFLTVTTLTAVFALMVVSGRFVAWLAPGHEKGINEYLSAHGLQVEGLKIRWSGLNPIIQADKVEASGVSAEGVSLEIDVILSLWRNRFSLSNFSANHVQAELNLSERNRQASGADARPAGFGVIDVLFGSQNLDVRITGVISSIEGETQTVKAKLQSQTIEDQKVVFVELEPMGSCEGCGLEIRYLRRKSAFLFPDIIESLHVSARDFELLPAAWNVPYLRNMSLNGTFELRSRNGLGKALADVQVRTLNESSPKATVNANLAVNIIKDEFHGVLQNAVVSIGNVKTHLPVANLATEGGFGKNHIWIDRANIHALVDLIEGFGVSTHPVIAWITGLGPEGELHDIQLRHDEGKFVVRANARDIQTHAHAAIPGVQIEYLEILGLNRDFLLKTLGAAADITFQTWLDQSRSFPNLDGSVLLSYRSNKLGTRIIVDRASYEGDEIAGRFGYLMNFDTDRRSMGLNAQAQEVAIPKIQQFVPNGTSKAVRVWLVDNIQNGVLHNTAAIYHSFQLEEGSRNSSVFEAKADLSQIIAQFHEDWPQLEDARGQIWLTDKFLDIDIESCHTAGILVNSGDVNVWFEDATVDVNFLADSNVGILLDYVESTPLTDVATVNFSNVRGSGQVDIVSTLRFEPGEKQPLVDIKLTLDDATLTLNAPSIDVNELSGSILFSTPFTLSSQDLVGSVFGNVSPIQISSQSSDDASLLRIQYESRFEPEDMVSYIGEWVEDVADGESDLRLNLAFATNGSSTSFVDIESSLMGIELSLPEPFGKSVETTRATRARIEFGDVPRVHFNSGVVSSFFDLRGNGGLHGSIGLNVPPPDYGPEHFGLLVTGHLDSLNLEAPRGGSRLNLPSHINLRELSVNQVEMQGLTFSDVKVDGIYSESQIDLTVESTELVGRVSKSGHEPFLVEVNRILLERQESRSGDPLSPAILNWIPTMNLKIDDILLVDEDQQESSFGAWTMAIESHEKELRIAEIEGDVRGLLIDGGITWNTSENTTRFLGNVQADQLHEVLPQWDYEPNVESKALQTEVDLKWPGSPLMFDLYATTGSFEGDLDEGRFLDVNAGGGALRIAGLLNFAVVLQRLRLDFKDVFREGTSFNRILFDAQTDKGILRIDEPLHIKTTGSDILLAGTMDLNTDTLDMEVVVTLPVSSSLPWWVGIATANPVAVIGSLVGKKIFEGPLNRMSSMKYRVTGSLDDPDIQFVGLFRDSLDGDNEDGQESNETVEGNEENE
ncbi:MAG: DUF3971 domain-containing protein [Gammaproteobacteria bacterium]|nr:DUF3971 domain-containing protein [Gammaproteobacteria bacterium]